MAFKILAVFVSALFVQTISGQCIPAPYPAEANLPCAASPEPQIVETPVFNGGGFTVTSYSALAPTGITVQSDNLAVEGPLAVVGKMPFLGVVTVDGPLPAVGQGAVSYGCGNGNVGIVSEGIVGEGLGISAGLTGLGYNGVGPVC